MSGVLTQSQKKNRCSLRDSFNLAELPVFGVNPSTYPQLQEFSSTNEKTKAKTLAFSSFAKAFVFGFTKGENETLAFSSFRERRNENPLTSKGVLLHPLSLQREGWERVKPIPLRGVKVAMRP